MSDSPNFMTFFLGDYPVVETKLGSFAIELAQNVHITIHVAGFPTTIKPGDTLPLFTKVPYNPRPFSDALFGKPPIK